MKAKRDVVPPERNRRDLYRSLGLEPTGDYCVLCYRDTSLLDHSASASASAGGGPRCVNRTSCSKSAERHRDSIKQFLIRLRRMPPPKRYEWVRAIREEIWPDRPDQKIRDRVKKDVDSRSTLD